MSHRVPAWQPVAESVAVVALIACGLIVLFTALPGDYALERAILYRSGGLAFDVALTEPWRGLSSLWIHADVEHLASNLIVLLLMSVLLTRALGWDRFVLIYLGSGLAGSVVSLVLEQAPLAVGASGAIFGLTGATVAYAIAPGRVLHEDEVFTVREAMLPIAGFQLIESFAPGISWGAHVGGFAFGAFVAGSGLATLGLPDRAVGREIEPVRWMRVIGSTLLVMSMGLVSAAITTGLLALYVGGLVVSSRTGPEFRPELKPVVMLSALLALGVNAAALAVALRVGDPWGLSAEAEDVALPGGLGEVPLPTQLVEARVEDERHGYPRVVYGDPDRFPFALQLILAEPAEPAKVVSHLLDIPVDGQQRAFTFGSWERDCPWLGWETRSQVGIVVFTGSSVTNLQLLRHGYPRTVEWRKAEDALVEALQDLPSCEPSEWTAGQLGLALAAAGLDDAAIEALGEALDSEPDAHDLRVLRGDLFLEARHCQGALLEFEQLTRDDPKRAEGWTGVARATLECGSTEDSLNTAKDAASRALKLVPGDPGALEARADALLGLGLRDEAAADLLVAAENATGPDERKRLEERAKKAERGFRVRDRID